MLKKLFSCILVGASVAGLLGHAQAGDNIVHLGQKPDVVHKSGSAMTVTTSLSGASRVIAPPGWTGFLKKGIDGKKESIATIAENEPWTLTLQRWLQDEGLKATVDWSKKRIFIDQDPNWQARVEQAPPVEVMPVSDQVHVHTQAIDVPVHELATIGLNQGLSDFAQPQELAHAVPAWEIKVSDVRLEAALERWTRQAGYRLLWDADRHILITAEDRFEGSFSQAINRVLNSPAIRHSDYPLEAVLYANDPPLLRITRLGEQQIKE